MTLTGTSELPVLSLVQELTALAPSGRDYDFVATPDERQRLAAALRVEAIPLLSAKLILEPSHIGARLSGQIVADVVQPCVITLDPVTQHITETIGVDFAPSDSEHGSRGEVEIDPDAADPPDPVVDGMVDIGRTIEEHLALAIDPYPRRQDAEVPTDYRPGKLSQADSPFSALRALHTEDTGKNGGTSSESND